MKVVALIQARLCSTRFPKKILADLRGHPLLWWTFEGVSLARMIDEHLVICPEKDFSEIHYALPSYQVLGSDVDEDDVAGRFIDYLNEYSSDYFVRICADSPLIHPNVIDVAVSGAIFQGAGAMALEGLPPGQQVQVFRTEVFKDAYPNMTAEERAHGGGPHFEINGSIDDRWNFCVDTPKDLKRVEGYLDRIDDNPFDISWPELIQRLS